MKRLSPTLLAFLFAPMLASAASLPENAKEFIWNISNEIVNPIITLGFTAAIVYLAWTVFQFTFASEKLDQVKLKNSLIYSVVGVFIMATVFALMRFIAVSVGQDPSIVSNNI